MTNIVQHIRCCCAKVDPCCICASRLYNNDKRRQARLSPQTPPTPVAVAAVAQSSETSSGARNAGALPVQPEVQPAPRPRRKRGRRANGREMLVKRIKRLQRLVQYWRGKAKKLQAEKDALSIQLQDPFVKCYVSKSKERRAIRNEVIFVFVAIIPILMIKLFIL